MEGLGSVWSGLDARKRIVVVAAAIAVFVAVLAVGRTGESKEMALLYGGLEPAAAGEVLAALEQNGVLHEVRESGIYVEAAARDRLRMTLAGEGLPANGAKGYELLDTLNGFGTTSQMFDAAYWRAKEGELARTIQSSSAVRSARVHISTEANRGFQRPTEPTASVTVSAAAGAIGPEQAQAFRYLVASAVPGLLAENVAVIDGNGTLIALAEDETASGRIADREEDMRARVERILAARVGAGNAVVELAIETETDLEQIVERRFDPEGRVAISTEVEERNGTSSDSGGGEVTVASNLPDGDAAGTGQSNSQSTESRELTNYEVSETMREITRSPGAIRRLSVAVLVNEMETTTEDGGTVSAPRPEEELEDLRLLVASAVGFDESRGDIITIRSMAFEPLPDEGSEPGLLANPGEPLDVIRLVQIAVLAVVAIVLGLFVIRPILASRPKAPAPEIPPALALDLPEARSASPQGAGRVDAGSAGLPAMLGSDHGGGDLDFGELPTFDMAMYDDGTSDMDLSDLDPVQRLRQLMEQRQEEALQILQTWVEDADPEEVT